MRSFILFSLALSTASATLTKRSPRLFARQSSDCYSTEKLCGTGCILSSYTCCPDREGGCPSYADCEMGDNGEYGCCPKGEDCTGDGGTNTQIGIPSFSFTYSSTPAATASSSLDSDSDSDFSSSSDDDFSSSDISSFTSDLSDIVASATATDDPVAFASSVLASLSTDSSFSVPTDYLSSASSILASLSTALPSATAGGGGSSSDSGSSSSSSGGGSGGAGVGGGEASEAHAVLPRVAAVLAGAGAVVAVVLM